MKQNNLYYLPDDEFISIYDYEIEYHDNDYLKRIYNRLKYKKMKEQILSGKYSEAVACI
jgi:hypothetical protein